MTFKGGKSYVPQVAEDLQSFPVIPPGAFPNGLGPATPYTAEVSSAAFASAEAQAQKNYAETEAARQAAKHKEEAEQLAWCRSEGGCGAGEGGNVSSCTFISGTGAEEPCGNASGEPTEAEWVEVATLYDGAEGITASASGLLDFKSWIHAVAHAASQVAQNLVKDSVFYWPTYVNQAKKAWQFYVELTQPDGLLDKGLSCFKEGQEMGEEVANSVAPPFNEPLVPVGEVLGCVRGVLGG